MDDETDVERENELSSTSPTVLIVEDERELADLYTDWLADTYTVRTSYNGREALEQMDESVDVVLLDRRMPNMSGEAVLEEIRERGYECRVAIVTTVDPSLDIIEMGFDNYLQKPVSEDDIHAAVNRLLKLDAYDDHMQEFYAAVSKKALLDSSHSTNELARSEEYNALEVQIAELEERLNTSIEELYDADESSQLDPFTALLSAMERSRD